MSVERGGFMQDDGTYTPERQELHKQIISEILTPEAIKRATPRPGEAPTLIMLGGRAGAGKSTALEKTGYGIDTDKYLTINADVIQEKLPGYDGRKAAVHNAEAQDIATVLERAARGAGINIIYDATMRTQKGAIDRMRIYAQAGYQVDGYFVHTTPEVSAIRCVRRALAPNGRYVPPEYSFNSRTNEATFDVLSTSFRKWAVFDNNGKEPKLVSRGGEWKK